jgi:hypothetical protein
MYQELKAEKILETLAVLCHRIEERFPGSGLSALAKEFEQTASLLQAQAIQSSRPMLGLRILIGCLVALAIGSILFIFLQHVQLQVFSAETITSLSRPALFFQVIESIINDLIFLAIGLYFLFSIETKIKRRKSLQAIHQLRSLAHIIDMHQLTKDPVNIAGHEPTPSSPRRIMNPFQLIRYLDYCTELLAIISKIGALFAQHTYDPIVHEQVSDLNQLTQGLSAKIWQKIMIMDRAAGPGHAIE